MKNWFLTLAALAVSTAHAADPAADLASRIAAKGTITIGTEGTYPPFTFHDADGKLTGYDVEVARLVAAKLGATPDFKETQWNAMLAGLNNHRFDLVANQVSLTTPERRAKYDKSDAYSYSGAVVVARADDDRVKTWQDLQGLKSGQSFTSNYAELATENGAEIIGVNGLAQALLLVVQKRADVTINDRLAVLDYLQKHPDAPLKIVLRAEAEPLGAGFVFNKGNEATIKQFNAALKTLRDEGRLTALSQQFFGEDVSQP